MKLTDKELAEDVVNDITIDEKFKVAERKKLELCEDCPSKTRCWSCGWHKWW